MKTTWPILSLMVCIGSLYAAGSSSMAVIESHESYETPFIIEKISSTIVNKEIEPLYGIDPNDIASYRCMTKLRAGVQTRFLGGLWSDTRWTDITKYYTLGLYSSNDIHLYKYKLRGGIVTSSPRHSKRLIGHAGPIFALSISTGLASGSTDGNIIIWPYARQFVVKNKAISTGYVGIGHSGPVSAVAWCNRFFPVYPIHEPASSNTFFDASACNDKYLISASHDRTIKMWDQTADHICTFYGLLVDNPTAIAWNFNNKFVFVGLANGMIEIWRVGTGRCIQSFWASTHAIRKITFNLKKKDLRIVAGNVKSNWTIPAADVGDAFFPGCEKSD